MPGSGLLRAASPDHRYLTPGHLQFLEREERRINNMDAAPESASSSDSAMGEQGTPAHVEDVASVPEPANPPLSRMDQHQILLNTKRAIDSYRNEPLRPALVSPISPTASHLDEEISFEEALYNQEELIAPALKRSLEEPSSLSYTYPVPPPGEGSSAQGRKHTAGDSVGDQEVHTTQHVRDVSYAELVNQQHYSVESRRQPSQEDHGLGTVPGQMREASLGMTKDESVEDADIMLNPSHSDTSAVEQSICEAGDRLPGWNSFPPARLDFDKLRQDSLITVNSLDPYDGDSDDDQIYNQLITRGNATYGDKPAKHTPNSKTSAAKKAREEKNSRYNRSSTPDNHKSEGCEQDGVAATLQNVETSDVNDQTSSLNLSALPAKNPSIAPPAKQPVSDLLIRFKYQANHLRPEQVCTPLDLEALFETLDITNNNDLSGRIISLKSSTSTTKAGHRKNASLASIESTTGSPAQPRIFDPSRNRWEIVSRTPTKSYVDAGPSQPGTLGRRKGRNLFPSESLRASESEQHMGASIEDTKAWDNIFNSAASEDTVQQEIQTSPIAYETISPDLVSKAWDKIFNSAMSEQTVQEEVRRRSVVYETTTPDLVSEKIFDIPPEKRLSIVSVEEVPADDEDGAQSVADNHESAAKPLTECEVTIRDYPNFLLAEARPSTPVLTPFVQSFAEETPGAETADKKPIEATPSKVVMNGLTYLAQTPMKDTLRVSRGSSPLRSKGSVRFALPGEPLTASPDTLTRNSSLECVRGTPVSRSLPSGNDSPSWSNTLLRRLRSRSPVRRSAESSPTAAGPGEALEFTSPERPSMDRRNSSTHGSIRGLFSRTNSHQAPETEYYDLAKKVPIILGTPMPAEGEKKTPRRRSSIREIFAAWSAEQKTGLDVEAVGTITPGDMERKTSIRRITSSAKRRNLRSAEKKEAEADYVSDNESRWTPTRSKSQKEMGDGSPRMRASPGMRGSFRQSLRALTRPPISIKLSSGSLRRKNRQDEVDDCFGVETVDWNVVHELAAKEDDHD